MFFIYNIFPKKIVGNDCGNVPDKKNEKKTVLFGYFENNIYLCIGLNNNNV